SQPPALGWRAAIRAATNATIPISTPPLPGTAVNDPARSSVCRMYFRLSMACSCSSTGCVRGVAITLDDTADGCGLSSTFRNKGQTPALYAAAAIGNIRFSWMTLIKCWRDPEGGILSRGCPPQVRALRAAVARLGAPTPDSRGEFLYLLRP